MNILRAQVQEVRFPRFADCNSRSLIGGDKVLPVARADHDPPKELSFALSCRVCRGIWMAKHTSQLVEHGTRPHQCAHRVTPALPDYGSVEAHHERREGATFFVAGWCRTCTIMQQM